MSAVLDRWRAFIESNPEAVAQQLDLLDRVATSSYISTYHDLLHASRGLLETRNTPNESRWAADVIRWALNAAEAEMTRDDMIETRIREQIWKARKNESAVAPGVYAMRGGSPNDCDSTFIRLAVFSLDDHSAIHCRWGCRDLTTDEAGALAAKLIAEKSAIEGTS